jgi:D-inositol-3-phosphate glycosyltransferase
MISEHASPLALLGGVDSGGQNVYVAQVARHLGERGHLVDVFTRRDSPRQAQVVPWRDNVRVIHVPAGPARFVRKEDLLGHMDSFAAFMTEFCRRERYDIAHANFWMSGLVARRLKRVLSLPYVITFHALGRVRVLHQGAADGFPKERILLEQSVIDDADCVISECPQDEEDLLTLYRADRRRITEIPCGYDASEMAPVSKRVARRLAGLPEKGRLLLQLGRIVPRKGIDNVVRGLGRLVHDEKIEARLMIVGGETDKPDVRATPEIERLRYVAKHERVEDRVLFLGRKGRDRLKFYYGAADVFITTPWYEPFGMTPLEAMACGRPVVGSAVGGIKHTVLDGKTGYLVPVNDPRALAEKLALIYRHPMRLRLMGWRAIQRAAEFKWESVADACARLYREVIDHGRVRDRHLYR